MAFSYLRSFFNSAARHEKPAKVSPKLLGTLPVDSGGFENLLRLDTCSDEDALRKLYHSSPTAYACVQRYLFALSPVRWEIRERVADNKLIAVENHPYERLLAYPNAHMDGGSLNRRICQHLLAVGNAFVRLYDGARQGDIVQLFPIMPTNVTVKSSSTEFISNYVIKDGNDSVDIPYNRMMHFQLENPEDFHRGIGVVQAGVKTLDSDSAAQNFWLNSIVKTVRKSGILSFVHNDPSDEELENAEQLLRNEVIGAWNAGGVMILGQEHTWTDLSKTTQDVDFIKARAALRELIASIFSVPAPMAGILDNSTYNNIQMARMIFWLDTLLPFLDNIAATMTRVLFFNNLKGDERYRYVVTANTASVEALYYVFGQKLDLALKLYKMAIPTKEIIRTLALPVPEASGLDFGVHPLSSQTTEQLIAGRPQTNNTRNRGVDTEEARLAPKRENVNSDTSAGRSL